jgi:uncharacterized protein
VFSFTDGVNTIGDLKIGMLLPGLVTNVTNFGAFVDIGVHQDGLVHISHLSDNFVKDPQQVVSVQQKVMVTVVEVDVPRKRIGLSMKKDPFAQAEPQRNTESGKPRRERPQGGPQGGGGDRHRDKPKDKPKEKEMSMEEKLALLVNKFKK